jgi:DNA polymerase/3'-5' exonuclease PolX
VDGLNENQRIAARLREAAERLEELGDNAFRVAAFRCRNDRRLAPIAA